jgi:C4-dicarboxylate transporter DctQ subunit
VRLFHDLFAWWGRAQAFLINAFLVLAGVLVLAAIFLIIIDVCIRALGFKPPGYTVAVVEYVLLYFVLLSAPYLVRTKGHVLTDILIQRLQGRSRNFVEKFVYIICISISLTFAFVGGAICVDSFQMGYTDERSIDVPYWLMYALFPPSFLLIAFEFLRYLVGIDSMYSKRDKSEVV